MQVVGTTEKSEAELKKEAVVKIFEKMWKEVATYHVAQLGGYPPWDECARTHFPRRYEQMKMMDDRLAVIQHSESVEEIESASIKYLAARKHFIDLIVSKFKESGIEKKRSA
jgi:hypothetical protein